MIDSGAGHAGDGTSDVSPLKARIPVSGQQTIPAGCSSLYMDRNNLPGLKRTVFPLGI